MPFRYVAAKHNLALLITGAIITLAILAILGLSLAYYGNSMSARAFDVIFRIIAGGATLFGVLMLLIHQARQTEYQHKSHHDLKGALNQTSLTVEHASQEVKRATNGDLDKRIACAVAAEMEKVLPKLVEKLCEKFEPRKDNDAN